jgi:type VI secretion system secreted protein Hcp
MSNVDSYLRCYGNIRGEATDHEFADALEVQGWKWGASFANLGITTAKGGHGDLQNFVFWHYLDSASPRLLQHCEQGLTIPRVTFHVRRQGGSAQKFVEIEFLKVRVLSLEMQSMEAGKLPMETITLAFNKVNYTYQPQDQSGAASTKLGPVSFDWIRELLA